MDSEQTNASIIEKTKDVKLCNCHLSARLSNSLRRAGFVMLSEVLAFSPESFAENKGFSESLEEELTNLREFVIISDRQTILEWSMDSDKSVINVALGYSVNNSEVLFLNDEGELCDDLHVNDLGFSVRTSGVLIRGKVLSLRSLCFLQFDEMTEFRGMGDKTISEILEMIKLRTHIMGSSSDEDVARIEKYISERDLRSSIDSNMAARMSVVEVALNRKKPEIRFLFLNDDGVYCDDIEIRRLNFSNRTSNVLARNRVVSFRDLALMPYGRMMLLKGMGSKTVDEILDEIRKRLYILSDTQSDTSMDVDEDLTNRVISSFSLIIDNEKLVLRKRDIELAIYQRKKADDTVVDEDAFLLSLAKHYPFRDLIRDAILSSVSECVYMSIERDTLIAVLSSQNPQMHDILESAVSDMEKEKLIRTISGKVCKYKLFLREWVDSLPDNFRNPLDYRCQGMTLEEAGSYLNVSRERVRQLVSKILGRRPSLYEDDYAELIKDYSFTREEIGKLFDLEPYQVNYLKIVCEKGTKDIQAFLDDGSIPEMFKENVPKAFKGKVVVIDGECIPLKRDVLTQALLRIFYSDRECTISEFEEFYHHFLRDNDLSDIEKLTFSNHRAFEARIIDLPNALTKVGHIIRYYDYSSFNINDLMSKINIRQYNNMEISTLLLYRDWPEVMEEYDIRDEYELHNIIRRNIDAIRSVSISMSRMPCITIGKADRKEQVEELLMQMAPVSNIDLANEYEKRYGVRANTALADHFSDIDVFYHDGIYDVHLQDLTDDEYEGLKRILTEDIYIWNDVVEKYHQICTNPKPDAINSMTLKKLGFMVFSQYVINSKYQSAESFFKNLLLRDVKIDLSGISQSIRTVQTFYVALAELRDNLDLIEVQNDVLYRFDYLSSLYNGITKEYLHTVQDEILLRLESENMYFSINAFIEGDKGKDLPEVVRNPYVFNSIIRCDSRYKTIKLSDVIIGTKKENDLSRSAIITYIIVSRGAMRISELLNILETEYLLRLHRSRVIFILESSDVVGFDAILDYVCLKEEVLNTNEHIFLCDTRFKGQIEGKKAQIQASDALIATVFWNEKYTEFVDYCGSEGLIKMRDMLNLDFASLFDNTKGLNISKKTVSEVINIYCDWVDGLGNQKDGEVEGEDILSFFFA